MKLSRRLKITHYSGLYKLMKERPKAVDEDAKAIFALKSDLYSFTEQLESGARMQKLASRSGYDYRRRGEQALAARKSPFIKILETGYIETHGVMKNQAGHTIAPSSGIFWMRVRWYDEIVFLHTSHMVSFTFSKIPQYANLHDQESLALAKIVRKHAAGQQLSFFSGDFNKDESRANERWPSATFARYGLETAWHELGSWPATHGGRCIDYVGNHKADGRVKALKKKVTRVNSDHRTVTVVYKVSPKKTVKKAA